MCLKNHYSDIFLRLILQTIPANNICDQRDQKGEPSIHWRLLEVGLFFPAMEDCG